MRRLVSCLALAFAAGAALAGPAAACGTCGCSVNLSEVGALGSGTNLYQRTSRFLLQQDVAYRAVNGSFNDGGALRGIPLDSSIQAFQATFGLAYYATPELLFGLQAPVVGNTYHGAAPGSFGTVELREATSQAAGLGDLALQVAYRAIEGDGPMPAIGLWLGVLAPSGRANGTDAEVTGAGVWNGQAGFTATGGSGALSYEASLGYQRPFGTPSGVATNFFIGDAVVAQGTLGYQLNPAWKAGITLSGYRGLAPLSSGSSITMSNLKVIPALTYAFSPDHAARLGVGFTPGYVAYNALSDLSCYVTFFQYFN